ncbi:hypothetical protein ACFQJ8_23285 [Halocatena marina]|uniref:hypothetical protein n=1 Tax=Halocatena marina TaxID=2934937 RepID=UPI00361285C0
MFDYRNQVVERYPTVFIMIVILLFVVLQLTLSTTGFPFIKQYGFYMQIVAIIVIPIIFIIIMYPVVGIPVARTRFRKPLSRRAMKKQALWTFLFLPGPTAATVVVVPFLAQFVHPLLTVPIIGEIVAQWSEVLSSYIGWIIVLITTLTAVLGHGRHSSSGVS